MTVIDKVNASQLEIGDYIDVDGVFRGTVLNLDDQGVSILVTLSDEDEYGDPSVVGLDPDQMVDILWA